MTDHELNTTEELNMTSEEFEIAEAMHQFGGSFVSALGALLKRADPQNRERLMKAFPEYFETYRQMVATLKQRQAQETRP